MWVSPHPRRAALRGGVVIGHAVLGETARVPAPPGQEGWGQ